MSLEQEFLAQLNWRYAAKRLSGEKLAPETLDFILESIRLAPASYGLQAFKVLVIEDEALRAKIRPVAYNQPQITEASHVLVFAVQESLSEADADEYMANIAAVRNIPVESLADFKGALMSAIAATGNAEGQRNWIARQAYIALAYATAAAAIAKVDATPMEGFDNAGVDAVLGLEAKGLRSVALLTLGYRNAAEDFLAAAPKVRKSKEDIFEMI